MTGHIHPPLVEVGPVPSIDTTRLFRQAQQDLSPIDKFIANTNAINKIHYTASPEGEPSPELCSVVVLGYLSAVEAYFRTLLSRLVHIDPITLSLLGQKQVLFSVAMARPRESLAEALYEDSFASVKELRTKLNEIGMGKLGQEMESALTTYDKICHIRHCCVHRFGYLGTKNANDLGLADHHHLVGGIFAASADELADIADALQQFVKASNNHIYRFVTDRTIDDQYKETPLCGWKWTWDFETDREHFEPYYDLFALKQARPGSASIEDRYEDFKKENAKKVEGMRKRKTSGTSSGAQGTATAG